MANHRFTDPNAELPPVYFKEWRQANGMTQSQVERRHGWSKGRLSRLESGAAPWTPQTLNALARTYNCTIGDLVSRLPPETTSPSLVSAPDAEAEPATRVGLGFTGVVEMQQLIGRLKVELAQLRDEVVPRLDQIERRIKEASKISDQVVRNAEELAEIFAHYAASVPRGVTTKEPEEL